MSKVVPLKCFLRPILGDSDDKVHRIRSSTCPSISFTTDAADLSFLAPLPPAAPSFAACKAVDVKRPQTLTLKVSGPADLQRFGHEDRKSSKARQCDAGSLSPRLTLVVRPPVRKRDSFSAVSTRMFSGQALAKKANVDPTTSKPKSVKGGDGFYQMVSGPSCWRRNESFDSISTWHTEDEDEIAPRTW